MLFFLVGRGGVEPPKKSTSQLCDLPNLKYLNSLRYMDFDMYPIHRMNIFENTQ